MLLLGLYGIGGWLSSEWIGTGNEDGPLFAPAEERANMRLVGKLGRQSDQRVKKARIPKSPSLQLQNRAYIAGFVWVARELFHT